MKLSIIAISLVFEWRYVFSDWINLSYGKFAHELNFKPIETYFLLYFPEGSGIRRFSLVMSVAANALAVLSSCYCFLLLFFWPKQSSKENDCFFMKIIKKQSDIYLHFSKKFILKHNGEK